MKPGCLQVTEEDSEASSETARGLTPCPLSPVQYASSRPSSTDTARLGSRPGSVTSHTRPESDLRPLSVRYSSPQQRGSYLQPIEASVLSQIYSTPFSAVHHAGAHWLENAPLVKVSQSGPLKATTKHTPGTAD